MSEGAVEPEVVTPGVTPEGDGAYKTLIGSLPEGLQQDPNLARHTSFEELAKEYAHLVPAIGRKGVLMPQEGNEQDIHRFLKELGRPDDASGYDRGDFTPPEGLPWDQDNEAELTSLMHSAGITQGQYEKLLRGYAELQAKSFSTVMETAKADHAKQVETLRSELGAAYEPSVNLAARAMQKVFGENAELLLQSRMADGNVLGNNPDFVRGMISVAKMFGEDELITDAGGRGPMGKTPAEAKAAIKAHEADKEFMARYMNPKDIGHAEANAEMDSLYAQAYPEGR